MAKNSGGAMLSGEPRVASREWYAGMALAGEMAWAGNSSEYWANSDAHKVAERCFIMADAMIAEGKK
jgi:hypothetical protein